MEVFTVPVQDKVLLYRPLRRLAFVGNQAMADLTMGSLGKSTGSDSPSGWACSTDSHPDALDFLEKIGFLKPDPLPPAAPECEFKPTSAVLLLTSRCNLRCIYCYAGGGERTVQDISPEMARAAIDIVHQNAVEQKKPRFELIFHGGGEPVQALDVIQEAVAYAHTKELPFHTSMVSNGVWSKPQREWIIKNLDAVGLSVDGCTKTQNRQRPLANGKPSSRAVMQTIRALDDAGFKYGIRMTALPPWPGTLPEDVAFLCDATNAQSIQVEPAFNTQRGTHRAPTQPEAQAFIEGFKQAFEIAVRAGRQLIYSGARPWILTQSFCQAPYLLLIVTPSGRLVGCFEATDDEYPLFDAARVGYMDGECAAVDKASRRALHETLAQRRAICRDCFCYWHCAGDCYSRVFAPDVYGQPDSSPRCAMNREITAHILLWYIAHGNGVWRGQGGHLSGKELMKVF
jgi:uncharacterized protein